MNLDFDNWKKEMLLNYKEEIEKEYDQLCIKLPKAEENRAELLKAKSNAQQIINAVKKILREEHNVF